METSLKQFRAAIIQSNFVKFRPIQEVLYDGDSTDHMEDITKKLKDFEYTPKASSEKASQASDEIQASNTSNARFTWIHLPSTNVGSFPSLHA